MLAAVGCEDYGPTYPYYRRLCELVAQGVRLWRRQLLRIAVGRAFLVTLACEGGLPLKLVLKEQARLRRFFQALLEEVRLFGPAGMPPEQLAERVDYLLPKSLRKDIVYKLSGNLITRIWQLQAEVGESETPVLDLDRKRADWRDDLPLSVEDDVARALLNNLLLDAADVARGRSGRVRWSRFLLRGVDGYRLSGELYLPGTLSPKEVRDLWPSVDPIPQRFEIWAEHEGKAPMAVSFVTQRRAPAQGENESDSVFALEHVSGDKAPLPARAVAGAHAVVLRALREEARSDAFSGAIPLSALPWVFEEAAEEDRLRLVGEGSTNVRASAAVVALPTEACIEPCSEATVTELGSFSAYGRRLVRVRGAIVVNDEEGNRIIIRTGLDSAEQPVEYRLRGRVLELGRDRRICYLGPPRVLAFRPEGITTAVEAQYLEWKPDLGGREWTSWGRGCVGEGTARFVEAGTTRWSSRICILPADAGIELRPGSSPSRGSVRLRGFGFAEVAVRDPPDRVRYHAIPEGPTDVLIEVEAETPPPADLDLLVRWPGEGEARLTVPFPGRDARFEVEGLDRLEDDAAREPVVAVNQLSRVRAVVVAPERGEGYCVLGSFRGEAAVRVGGRDGLLLIAMSETTPGLYERGLGVLQHAISSRFTFSTDPDAYVRLIIQSNFVSGLPRRGLRVARFDIELRRVGGDTKVRVSSDSLRQLSWADLDLLRVEALPLLVPDHSPVVLERAQYDYMWHVPEARLEPGPWLIVAWDGNWCRARPLWWFVSEDRSEAEADPHRLIDFFRGDKREDRRTAGERLVAELKTDTSHPGWPLIDVQVELTQHLPASTLELLCELARDPEAAALAALRAPSENDFLRLWRGLETLPFWWRAVPAECWISAGVTYVAGLRDKTVELEQLLGQEETETLVRAPFDMAIARVRAELPHLAPVLARATARSFSESPGPDFTRLLHRQVREILMAQRQPFLANAYVHVGDMTRYPDLTCVSEMAGILTLSGANSLWVGGGGRNVEDRAFQVHNAPIAAAISSIEGHRLSEPELFSLRTTAELTPWWFSEVFDLTFLCALGIEEERRSRRDTGG
jgi:hypothetical protein